MFFIGIICIVGIFSKLVWLSWIGCIFVIFFKFKVFDVGIGCLGNIFFFFKVVLTMLYFLL